ncbi:MAG: hypothetical protein QHJ73_02210, partial [Armatimonadota bacterium]|nr:hypothetical protein [Armatimonadota bacterium]
RNLYHLSNGTVVDADDTLYRPTVVAQRMEEIAGPGWQQQNRTAVPKATGAHASRPTGTPRGRAPQEGGVENDD